jgi:parvulin-like peptidyl-prolyl isomerase
MRQAARAWILVLWAPLATLVALPAAAAEVSPSPAAVEPPRVFATVGDTVITLDEYIAEFTFAMRQKFYHGRAPEGELARLQRDVGDRLVARLLQAAEARRRGLQPDQEQVRKALAETEQRYATNEQWKKDREQVLPGLIAKLEQNSLVQRLEAAVREGAVPTAQQVAEYYAAHLDQFTEPEQLRLRLILLKVDPSSPKAEWEKAQQDAEAIAQQLRDGADFSELARQRSGDARSAALGGDMGYQHSGMLPDAVQAAFKESKPGDLSVPVRLMEGVAVLRLDERKPAKLMSFEAARERAQQLSQRELGELAWKALTVSLQQQSTVKIDESHYLPLPEPPAEPSLPK